MLGLRLEVVGSRRVPLRKGLVAANVPPLAGLAPVPRLGVALARRATTWTGHRVLPSRLNRLEWQAVRWRR